jgi:hypothetical protein
MLNSSGLQATEYSQMAKAPRSAYLRRLPMPLWTLPGKSPGSLSAEPQLRRRATKAHDGRRYMHRVSIYV